MKVVSIFLLILLSGVFFAKGQEPVDLVKQFFIKFDVEGSGPALDFLYKDNRWMEQNREAISILKTKMEGLTPDFIGPLHGYELINKKQISVTYAIYTYLAKYERQPIRFIFTFYRPDEQWRVQGFRFDANIDEELEEIVKNDQDE